MNSICFVGAQTHAQISETLLGCESIRLFQEKAQSVDPSFTLTQENIATVAQICAGGNAAGVKLQRVGKVDPNIAGGDIAGRGGGDRRVLEGDARRRHRQSGRAQDRWGRDGSRVRDRKRAAVGQHDIAGGINVDVAGLAR